MLEKLQNNNSIAEVNPAEKRRKNEKIKKQKNKLHQK